MRKKNAINELQKRIDDLNKSDFDIVIWVNVTTDLIKKIFTVSSNKKNADINSILYNHNTAVNKAKQYIEAYVNEIKNGKVEKVEKRIDLLINWKFWFPVVGATFILGIYLGQAKFDSAKNNLYEQNQKLIITDSLQKVNINVLRDSIKLILPPHD